MSTKLHYSDVLSATDGRLISFDGMEGVYRVFDAVAGPGVTTLAIMYLNEKVRVEILRQYPELGNEKIKEAVTDAIAYNVTGELENLKISMEAYVRPLVKEYYEITHLDEKTTNEAMEAYKPWLAEKLKGKEVIVVIT